MELEDLVEKLREENNDCQLVCQGDGSGTIWHKPSGYSCLSVEPHTGFYKVFLGGASVGTNNFAELSPYLLALANHEKNGNLSGKIRIFTDSEMTAKCGNKEYVRAANLFLWRGIEYFEERFAIEWQWIPREQNVLLDVLSRKVRLALEAIV